MSQIHLIHSTFVAQYAPASQGRIFTSSAPRWQPPTGSNKTVMLLQSACVRLLEGESTSWFRVAGGSCREAAALSRTIVIQSTRNTQIEISVPPMLFYWSPLADLRLRRAWIEFGSGNWYGLFTRNIVKMCYVWQTLLPRGWWRRGQAPRGSSSQYRQQRCTVVMY